VDTPALPLRLPFPRAGPTGDRVDSKTKANATVGRTATKLRASESFNKVSLSCRSWPGSSPCRMWLRPSLFRQTAEVSGGATGRFGWILVNRFGLRTRTPAVGWVVGRPSCSVRQDSVCRERWDGRGVLRRRRRVGLWGCGNASPTDSAISCSSEQLRGVLYRTSDLTCSQEPTGPARHGLASLLSREAKGGAAVSAAPVGPCGQVEQGEGLSLETAVDRFVQLGSQGSPDRFARTGDSATEWGPLRPPGHARRGAWLRYNSLERNAGSVSSRQPPGRRRIAGGDEQ